MNNIKYNKCQVNSYKEDRYFVVEYQVPYTSYVLVIYIYLYIYLYSVGNRNLKSNFTKLKSGL